MDAQTELTTATQYTTGILEIEATLMKPVIHGAEDKDGNTTRLRTEQLIITALAADGTPMLDEYGREMTRPVRVPFVSGNSLKHHLRDGMMRFALDVLEPPDYSQSKRAIDLLSSGGHPTKGGQSIDLRRIRRVTQLFPALSVCGYCSGSAMEPSKLQVCDLDLVCLENRIAGRVPARLADSGRAWMPQHELTDEDFLARPDSAHDPALARRIRESEGDEAIPKADDDVRKLAKSQQVSSGAVFYGRIDYRDLTDGELAALWTGLTWASLGAAPDGGWLYTVGAMKARGRGRISARFANRSRVSPWSPLAEDDRLQPFDAGDLPPLVAAYAERLRETRDEVLALIEEVA